MRILIFKLTKKISTYSNDQFTWVDFDVYFNKCNAAEVPTLTTVIEKENESLYAWDRQTEWMNGVNE